MKPPVQPTPPPITPEQLRDARVALGWSSDRLAARSETTARIINEYERCGRVTSWRGQPRDFDALASIRAALEAAGIEFIQQTSEGLIDGQTTRLEVRHRG